jgi:uncharacterized protein (TIGR02611 family)
MQKAKKQIRRVAIGTVGGIVLVVGIIAIPYPGPGWLIVFTGLGILSTEFAWAQRILDYAKGKYDAWQAWLKRQPLYVQMIFLLLTLLVVLVTIWLVNGYGLLNNWLDLGWDWLQSPFLTN